MDYSIRRLQPLLVFDKTAAATSSDARIHLVAGDHVIVSFNVDAGAGRDSHLAVDDR